MTLLEYYARNLGPNVSLVERHWNNVHEEKGSPADRPASFRRPAYKIEPNEKGSPADGPARFRRSAYKIELNEKRKPGG